ncbi:MAG: hypothetical protein U0V73_13170 [Acidimicrobiia bacterium]
MTGLEVIEIVVIGGEEFTVYGAYSQDTPPGEHDYYDVYLLNRKSGILELVDLGEPLSRQPSHGELDEIAQGLFGSAASSARQAS